MVTNNFFNQFSTIFANSGGFPWTRVIPLNNQTGTAPTYTKLCDYVVFRPTATGTECRVTSNNGTLGGYLSTTLTLPTTNIFPTQAYTYSLTNIILILQ
jgi:hypothetical protein